MTFGHEWRVLDMQFHEGEAADMRVDGSIPIDPIVQELWRLRRLSAKTMGVHLAPAKRTILETFSGTEPGRTFAACLIVSDGIEKLRIEAQEHLLERIAVHVAVDPLTGMLCVEALQFVPRETLTRPEVRRFLKHCTQLRNPLDLAFILLERADGEGST